MDYKSSGVDIKKGEDFVDGLKKRVLNTYHGHKNNIIHCPSGYASLYQLSDEKILASGTDGVGTKVKLCNLVNDFSTVGIDLVAMCVNDILCTGARPLFFLDYMAMGKLEISQADQLIDGIIKGCEMSGCALLGGETAEMPGVYQGNDFDLAGFCVGEVSTQNLIDGKNIKAGDQLIGVKSSGFHSNGYSLIRKLADLSDRNLVQELLTPTKIYVQEILKLLRDDSKLVNGMAHITGSGFRNISRMNDQFSYHIESLPSNEYVPEVFSKILGENFQNNLENYKTFNMGIGLVLATSHSDQLYSYLEELNLSPFLLGEVKESKSPDVLIKNQIL